MLGGERLAMAFLHPSSPEFQALAPFEQLVEIMRALRSPQGCPWDLKQDHRSLMPYLIEEAYECLEAIDGGVDSELCQELGDLLLQVVFHAQLAQEGGRFDIDQVCQAIVAKMVRRHPHVFERQGALETSDQVLQQWDQIKQAEKGAQSPRSSLDGVSRGLPGLPQAVLLQERASRQGFVFPTPQAAWSKVEEELRELQADPSAEELGDVLFALVNWARLAGLDPEAALRQTNRKFRQRFAGLEQQFPQGLAQQPLETLLQAWIGLKTEEKSQ